MASLAEFSWRRIALQVRHFVGARLRATPPLLHKRLSVPCAVALGVVCFLLPYVLWWLTPTSRGPAPPSTLDGIELQQLLSALHTVLADPTLGHLNPGTPSPFALADVDVAVHFVVQKSTLTSGAPLYRLVPVDTTLQTRQEHVQTLTIHLTPTPPFLPKLGSPVSSATGSRPTEEAGVPQPSPLKKRPKP